MAAQAASRHSPTLQTNIFNTVADDVLAAEGANVAAATIMTHILYMERKTIAFIWQACEDSVEIQTDNNI